VGGLRNPEDKEGGSSPKKEGRRGRGSQTRAKTGKEARTGRKEGIRATSGGGRKLGVPERGRNKLLAKKKRFAERSSASPWSGLERGFRIQEKEDKRTINRDLQKKGFLHMGMTKCQQAREFGWSSLLNGFILGGGGGKKPKEVKTIW